MIEIRLKEFPTHLPTTNNKKAPDKYAKLNYQSIYNGSINRFGRANLMNALHSYFMSKINKKYKIKNFPIKIHYIIKTVINHGDIRRNKNGKISWKYPSKNYIPTWDIENLANIWIKGGNDSLTKAKIIPDDSVEFLLGTSHEFIQVNSFKDREIIIKIEEL